MKKIAIIGAGLSGLVLATTLSRHAEVIVFEKSRGVGGRMSTRYADPFQFDHGAQYFTARSQAFRDFLAPYIDRQIVRLWHRAHITIPETTTDIQIVPCYVGSPRMTELARDLSNSLEIKTQSEIRKIIQDGSGWRLENSEILSNEVYDWVIMTAPAPQCAKLMPPLFKGHESLSRVKMTGCYSLMMGFDEPLALGWDSCSIHNSPIGWMAVNSGKPLRETEYSLIAQSTNEWAERHIDDDISNAQSILFDEVVSLFPKIDIRPAHLDTHRWRYAATSQPAGQNYLIDEDFHLAVCGDWCLEGKVESAFTSGHELGLKIIDILKTS